MTTAQPYLTAKEAAAEVGLSYTRIRTLLRQGRVTGAIKPQRDWMVPSPVKIIPPTMRQAKPKILPMRRANRCNVRFLRNALE